VMPVTEFLVRNSSVCSESVVFQEGRVPYHE
jgi:hypothetical protein